jgi:hypothetical protein
MKFYGRFNQTVHIKFFTDDSKKNDSNNLILDGFRNCLEKKPSVIHFFL